MAIDLDEMMFAGRDHRGFASQLTLVLRMNKLLSEILKGGTMADLQALFDAVKSFAERPAFQASREAGDRRMGVYYMCRDATRGFLCDAFFEHVDNDNYRAIIDSGWMSQFETPLLQWFYGLLRQRYRTGGGTYVDRILTSDRIVAEKKALLCRVVFDCEAFAERTPRGFVCLPPLWYYNRSICGRIMDVKNCREHRAIMKIGLARHDGFRASAAMEIGVARDSFAVFELNRELEARKIGDSMLEHLIRSDAARCFTGLLSRHPDRVFKLRSPQEWLITVCRYAREKLAVAAADEIERQFPGIVGSARDPWGNTPLWNTFVNANRTDGLQTELIRLGCDPNAKNEWGLSYRLLKDNGPEKFESAGD